MRITRRITPGELYCAVMPHSEVCVHMQVAGKFMYFRLADNLRSVQLYQPHGPLQSMTCFSAPILPGEAGVYEDSDGPYFNTDVPMAEFIEMFADCT